MAKGKKRNKYEKKASKEHFTKLAAHRLETKGSVKNSGIELGRDLLVGVVGGGLVGAAIGKPAFYAGLALTGAAHYMGQPTAALLGVGMMASSHLAGTKSTDGISGMDMNAAKDRVKAFKDSLVERTYLDKVLHRHSASDNGTASSQKAVSKAAKEEVSGIGDLQFFNYGSDMGSPDFPELEYFHNHIKQSGMNHMEKHGMPDVVGEIEGAEEHSFTEGIDDNEEHVTTQHII